jgi:23S rRNA (uracil1939-C5)-methyltransferase
VATGERSAWLTGQGALITGLPPDVRVGPDAVIHEDVAGHRFRVSAPAFFQSSPQGAEALVAAVRTAAGELATAAAHAVDAYAGGGLFAATVFGPDVRVTAIESSPCACADARVNAPRARVVEGPVEQWSPEVADLVVADPARAGLGKAGVAAVAATGAARIVLVSCDPVALARDAQLLAEAGYGHAGSEVFDLFPHTPHVEVVTRFDRV